MVVRKAVAALSVLAIILGIATALPFLVPAIRQGPATFSWQFLVFLSPSGVLTVAMLGAIFLPPKQLRRALLVLALLLLAGSIVLPAMRVSSAIACLGFVIIAFVARKQPWPSDSE
jgi:hypothetical protein